MTSGMPFRPTQQGPPPPQREVTLQLQNVLKKYKVWDVLLKVIRLSFNDRARNDWKKLVDTLDEEFSIGFNSRVAVKIEIDDNLHFISRGDVVHVIPPQQRVYLFDLTMAGSINPIFRVLQTFSYDHERDKSNWFIQCSDMKWKRHLEICEPKFNIDQGFESLFMFTGHELPKPTEGYSQGTLNDYLEYLGEIQVAWTKLLVHPDRELFLKFWRTFYNYPAIQDQGISEKTLLEVLIQLNLK